MFLRELVTPMMRASTSQMPFAKVKTESRRLIFPARIGERQIVVQWSKEFADSPSVWIEAGTNFVFLHLKSGHLNEIDLPVLAQAFYGSSYFPLIESLDPRISEMKYQVLKPGMSYIGTPSGFESRELAMTKYESDVTELIQYARVYGKIPRDLQNTARLWNHRESPYLLESLKHEDEKTQAAFSTPRPTEEKTEPPAQKIPPQQKSPVLRKSFAERASEKIAAFIRAQGRKPHSQIEDQLYSLMNTHKSKADFLQVLQKDPEVWLIFSTETRKGLPMEDLADAVSAFIRIHGTTPATTGEKAEAHLYAMMFSHRTYPTFIQHMMKDERIWKIYSESIKREEVKASEVPKLVAKDLIRFVLRHRRKPMDQDGESDLFAAMTKHAEDPAFIADMQANPKVWQIYSAPPWGKIKAEELIAFIKANKRKPKSTSTGAEYWLHRTSKEFMNDPEFIKAMEAEAKAYAIFKKPVKEKPRSIVEVDAESLVAFVTETGQLPNPRRKADKDLHMALKRHEKNPEFLQLLKAHPTVWKVFIEAPAQTLIEFISDYNRVPNWSQKSERELYETMRRFEKDPDFIERMQSRSRAWRIFESRDTAVH